jgi:RimJ/RimL family protein N-acetyltransferase
VWEEAERITHGQPYAGDGLIAFVDLVDYPNSPVAVARYVKLDEKTAEIAISVRDDWQNQGIGSQLLRRLMEEAHKTGLEKLVGTMQNGNDPMWHVLKQMPFPVSRVPDGAVAEIEVDLTKKTSEVPCNPVLRQLSLTNL